MKERPIADLARFENAPAFDAFYLCLSKSLRSNRSGGSYLALTLGDSSGQIETRMWDGFEAVEFEKGDVLKVRAQVCRYEGRLQLKAERLRRAGREEVALEDLLPHTRRDIAAMWAELEGFVAGFEDRHLRALVSSILAEEAVAAALREAPAAKGLHHAWIGGLLEHIVSLLGLAERVAAHYPRIHRDLLLTGVVLHDIGKLRELEWHSGFDYSLEGQLIGHIPLGISLIEKQIDALPGFPPALRILVLHMVLSHHGRLEFGSPKLPMIPEALLLHFLDDTDAKLQAVWSEFDRNRAAGRDPAAFTDRIWSLDQRTMLDTRAWLASGGADEPAGEAFDRNEEN